ncbi:MAG: hypothetical protein J7L96_00250, partial [Bacteroidales bacterium]|nr:hypothetical protein [Bacteroidales bacterium]
MKKILQKILLNSWFIAFALGSLVFIAIPFHSERYIVKTVRVESGDEKGTWMQFHDIDGDGMDEKVETLYNEIDQRYSQLVLKTNGKIWEQYNEYHVGDSHSNKCFIGDYNGDGLSELFSVFAVDSEVFINCIGPFCDTCKTTVKKIKIY